MLNKLDDLSAAEGPKMGTGDQNLPSFKDVRNRIIWFGFAVAILSTIAVSIISYRSAMRMHSNTDRVRHSYEAIQTLDDIGTSLLRAEDDQWTYIFTGDESYFRVPDADPYHLKQKLKALRELTRDNSSQQQQIDQLQPRLMENLALSAQVATVRREKGIAAAADATRSLYQERNHLIFAMLSDLTGEEQALLAQGILRERSSAQYNFACILGAAGFALLWLLFAGIYVRKMLVAADRGREQKSREDEEIRQARKLAESTRQRAEFIDTMSHEIRTPLNGVLGMTQLLLLSELNPDQREYAETVWSASELLLGVVNDILDFSRLAAGKVELETVDFDLTVVLEATLDMFAVQAQAKGVELGLQIDAQVPRALRGDPNRLRQVTGNLISNAVKFTDHGEVIVHVSRIAEDAHSASIRLEVRDTGEGVSDELAQRLFQPFAQADRSTSRKHGGSGLGLAISAQLIERMHGSIGVTGTSGVGSTFHFEVTLEKQKSSAIADQECETRLQGLAMLVVDDNATNRLIVSAHLRSWGIDADGAANGADALSALRAKADAGHPYDLAIIDSQMPGGMNGIELMQAIRDDPRIKSLRTLLMSSLANGLQVEQGQCDGWVPKPIKRARLFENLCRLMQPADEDLVKEKPVVSNQKAIPLNALDGGGKKKVLVVEDGRINRRVAVLQLSSLGYQSEPVESGEAALEALARERYDIILMDCEMPGMDGYETTRRIRINEGNATHTVVVAITAHAMEGVREKCLAAGMDDYISKPVKIGVLGGILERWCGPLKIAPPAIATEAIPPELAFGPELDISAIDELQTISSASPVVVREIIDMFLVDLPEQVALIKSSQASGNLPAVGAVAHSLKGASQGIGASRLANVCTHLEIFARAGSALRVSALTDRLEKETAALRPLLEQELTRRK